MGAGTQYSKHLNYDQAYVKTPAVYDSDVDEWLMPTQNYVYTGTLWVPQKAAATGEAEVQLTGSSIQDSQAVPMSQAQKDIAMRAYENIIDIIGAENIVLLLPMWETSGTEFSDLLRPHVKFVAEGVTLGQSGLLHPVPNFDGVNDYVRQKPITEAIAGSSEYALDNSSYKIAQKLVPGVYGDIKFAMFKLKKVGSPVANMVWKIITDKEGQPTGPVVATSNANDVSSFPSSPALMGFYLSSPCIISTASSLFWLVLEYSSPTTIDSSNYVSVTYDSSGAYGQPLATYNGSSWTIENEKSCVFAVYSDDLTLDGDYSIIAAVRVNSYDKPILSPAVGNTISDGGSFIFRAGTYYNLKVSTPGGGLSDVSKAISSIEYPSFGVYGYTFSYSAGTNKLNIYRGAKLLVSGNGTPSSGPNPPEQPFVIGTTRHATNFAYQFFLSGKIGPVIAASAELTQAQMGKIYNQLLALRRLKEAV